MELLSEPSALAFEKGTAMKKTLMALAAVATLAVSTASPAQAWRGWWGPGVAAGLIGGAIVGGAIASSPYYYGPCYWQHQRFWDGFAWRVRNVRVCS